MDQTSGPKIYEFEFAVIDDDCKTPLSDTLLLTVNVEDVISDPDIDNPVNVFTPNGDGVNDTYFIPNLPSDNCVNEFIAIRIYNRWGQLVFENDVSDVVWDGKGYPAGVYYYVVEYNNFDYRGVVSIRN